MVVKDRAGRTRYMVFEIDPTGHERGAVIKAVNTMSSKMGIRPSPRLTVFDGTKGIVRCDHREVGDVKHMLHEISEIGGVEVKVRTIVTSGTLRKAKEYL